MSASITSSPSWNVAYPKSGLLGKFGLHLRNRLLEKGSPAAKVLGPLTPTLPARLFQMPRRTCHGPPRSRHRFQDQMVSTIGLPARPNPCMQPSLERPFCCATNSRAPRPEGFFVVSHRCICALPWWPYRTCLEGATIPILQPWFGLGCPSGLNISRLFDATLEERHLLQSVPKLQDAGITLKHHGHPQARTPRRPTSQAQANALGKTPNHRGGEKAILELLKTRGSQSESTSRQGAS